MLTSLCSSSFVSCTVMSGNSADSFSDSEVEEEKEEVKEKTEVIVKKKGPGRPPRKKRAPVPSPIVSPPNTHKRRCIPPKSGNCSLTGITIIMIQLTLLTLQHLGPQVSVVCLSVPGQRRSE